MHYILSSYGVIELLHKYCLFSYSNPKLKIEAMTYAIIPMKTIEDCYSFVLRIQRAINRLDLLQIEIIATKKKPTYAGLR